MPTPASPIAPADLPDAELEATPQINAAFAAGELNYSKVRAMSTGR